MSIVINEKDKDELKTIIINKLQPCCGNCIYFKPITQYCEILGWNESEVIYNNLCDIKDRKHCLCENFYPIDRKLRQMISV